MRRLLVLSFFLSVSSPLLAADILKAPSRFRPLDAPSDADQVFIASGGKSGRDSLLFVRVFDEAFNKGLLDSKNQARLQFIKGIEALIEGRSTKDLRLTSVKNLSLGQKHEGFLVEHRYTELSRGKIPVVSRFLILPLEDSKKTLTLDFSSSTEREARHWSAVLSEVKARLK